MPPAGLGSLTLDCPFVCRVLNTVGGLYTGTAVLVSDQGRDFGYALTCWHNLEGPKSTRKDFKREKTIEGIYLLSRYAKADDEAGRKPVTVVGNWSSRVYDVAVLKVPAEVIEDFKLRPAPVSYDLHPGMELVAVGFPRTAELAGLDVIEGLWIPGPANPADRQASVLKDRLNGQTVFEAWSERPIPWEPGISGGALLHLSTGGHVLVGLPSLIETDDICSQWWRGSGVPVSVVARTWTSIAEHCSMVKIPPSAFPAALRHSYLSLLLKEASGFTLAAVDPGATGQAVHLDAVYTALLTVASEDDGRQPKTANLRSEPQRLSALEQLNRHPRLVLLGHPGGGKSTFVNFTAMCLAGEQLRDRAVNLDLLTAPLPDDKGAGGKKRQPWDYAALLPVRVILRDFAARGLPEPGIPATAEHVWEFIESGLGNLLRPFAEQLRRELHLGALVLFDGLDEVPDPRAAGSRSSRRWRVSRRPTPNAAFS